MRRHVVRCFHNHPPDGELVCFISSIPEDGASILTQLRVVLLFKSSFTDCIQSIQLCVCALAFARACVRVYVYVSMCMR